MHKALFSSIFGHMRFGIWCCALFIEFIGYSVSADESDVPIHQLRIYEVPSKNISVFHERFRDHAHRIMKQYGFNILAMWETEYDGKIEFVYLLSWSNETAMNEGWKQFMSDNEWTKIKAETGSLHGRFVNAIEDRTLRTTPYSPSKLHKFH